MKLDMIAKHLYENETITGEEFMKLWKCINLKYVL